MNVEKDIKLRISLLGENILESLEHISKLVANGNGDQTLDLMTDVLEGFQSIEEATGIVRTINPEEMQILTSRLRKSFDILVNAYEQQDEATVYTMLENNVLPEYRSWFNHLQSENKSFS